MATASSSPSARRSASPTPSRRQGRRGPARGSVANPRGPRRRAGAGPRRVQHRSPARRDRLRHARGRAHRKRRSHPPSTPRRTRPSRPGPGEPHAVQPPARRVTMLANSSAIGRAKSETPHLDRCDPSARVHRESTRRRETEHFDAQQSAREMPSDLDFRAEGPGHGITVNSLVMSRSSVRIRPRAL